LLNCFISSVCIPIYPSTDKYFGCIDVGFYPESHLVVK